MISDDAVDMMTETFASFGKDVLKSLDDNDPEGEDGGECPVSILNCLIIIILYCYRRRLLLQMMKMTKKKKRKKM